MGGGILLCTVNRTISFLFVCMTARRTDTKRDKGKIDEIQWIGVYLFVGKTSPLPQQSIPKGLGRVYVNSVPSSPRGIRVEMIHRWVPYSTTSLLLTAGSWLLQTFEAAVLFIYEERTHPKIKERNMWLFSCASDGWLNCLLDNNRAKRNREEKDEKVKVIKER